MGNRKLLDTKRSLLEQSSRLLYFAHGSDTSFVKPAWSKVPIRRDLIERGGTSSMVWISTALQRLVRTIKRDGGIRTLKLL
jgi:hypothetical protein